MLDRLRPFVTFEMPEDGGSAAVTEPEAEAGVVAEPEAGAVSEAEVATPTPAPEIDWANIEILRAAAEQLAALGYNVTQAQPEPAAAAEEPAVPDPFADNWQEQLDRWYEAKRAADLGPLNDYVQADQAARTNAVIDDAITAAAAAAKLEDPDAGVLRSIAQSFATRPEYARYGATLEGVQASAKAAADWLAARDKTRADAAVTRYRVQIGEIQDTPAEPGAGSGGGLQIEAKPKTYDEIIASFEDRF